MNYPCFRKKIKLFILLVLLAVSLYGAGRLYYRITDGFAIGNITSDFPYDSRWETKPLSAEEQSLITFLLDQKFSYLGKGCQSYVFLSEDQQYVLKFFKYQRFRVQPWIDFFAFIPWVDHYRQQKLEKKRLKREGFFASWKLAVDELKPETGLVYVHLNKTDHLNKKLSFSDKMGLTHQIDLDQVEFLVQKKAAMLCPTIKRLMEEKEIEQAKALITSILEMTTSEYQRGLADNDHALMQNTGVYEGRPIHIDVGQFIRNDQIMQPPFFKQELFSKTYKFHKWLHKEYPELAAHLELKLRFLIGPEFDHLKPIFKSHD